MVIDVSVEELRTTTGASVSFVQVRSIEG